MTVEPYASRNPRIARALADLGVMRDQGEGIPRMFEEMESSFLPLPALDVVAGRFRAVLQNNPIFRIDDPKWPHLVRALPISLPQKRAMVGLVDREFSNADYCALNAVDRDTAYRELHDLVECGLVQATGNGAGMRYRVVRGSVAAAGPTTASPMDRLVTRMAEAGFITNTDYHTPSTSIAMLPRQRSQAGPPR